MADIMPRCPLRTRVKAIDRLIDGMEAQRTMLREQILALLKERGDLVDQVNAKAKGPWKPIR